MAHIAIAETGSSTALDHEPLGVDSWSSAGARSAVAWTMTMSETTVLRTRRAANASPLAAAHNDPLRPCHAAERTGDWKEAVILSALVEVADHVKRIGDNPDSSQRG